MKKIFLLSALLAFGVLACKTSKPATNTNTTTVATDSPEVVAGKELYLAKCGKCHDLKKTTAYNEQRWGEIVDWMAPKAKLNDTEKSQVLAYVQKYAKK